MTKTNTHHRAFAPMLESPIPLLIARLAVPTIISMLVTAIYNMADTFFASQLGTSASGAVGIVFSLMAIIQVPSLSRQGLASVATVALNVQAGAYGDATVAGMSITGRIFMFVLSVMIGLGQGFQPVAGFCYGAKRYDRVKKGFIFTLILGFVLLTLAAFALFFGAPALIRLFRDDPLVIEVGTNAVRYQSVALPLLSLIMTGNMLLQSTGHAHQATFLSMCRQGVFFLPLILVLPPLWRLTGVEVVQPVSDIFSAVTAVPFVVAFFKKVKKLETEIELLNG